MRKARPDERDGAPHYNQCPDIEVEAEVDSDHGGPRAMMGEIYVSENISYDRDEQDDQTCPAGGDHKPSNSREFKHVGRTTGSKEPHRRPQRDRGHSEHRQPFDHGSGRNGRSGEYEQQYHHC